MDLIRKILLEVEEIPYDAGFCDLQIEGHSPIEVSYHITLLNQAGHVDGKDMSTMGNTNWKVRSLTWQGHEFLEASRDESRWNKAKTIMRDKGGGMVFDVFKQLLGELMKAAIFGSGSHAYRRGLARSRS